MNRFIELIKSNTAVLGLALFVLLTVLLLNTGLTQVWKYFLTLIGPTFYVLFPMGVLLVSIIILIALGKMDGRFPSVRELQLIEEGAPIVGLLGTVIALVKGFSQLDLTQAADSSIQIMIRTISESLYATPTGLSLGLIAWFVRKRFVPSILKIEEAEVTPLVAPRVVNESKEEHILNDITTQSNKKITANDALSALMNLGYKKSISEKAVNKALIDEPSSTEDVVKEALKYLAVSG